MAAPVYNCVPPWSSYTLTDRGKLVHLPLNLLSLVEDQLEADDHRHFVESTFRHARHLHSNLEDSDASSCSTDYDTNSQTNSEPSDTGSLDAMDIDGSHPAATEPMSDDSSEEDVADEDYMPSPEWISGFVDHWASYLLRGRLPNVPEALADCSPVPKILTAGHMDALNFSTIKWDEPRPFTDVVDRIAGFFVGPPAERTDWERTIIQASNEMYEARARMTSAEHDQLNPWSMDKMGSFPDLGFGGHAKVRSTVCEVDVLDASYPMLENGLKSPGEFGMVKYTPNVAINALN
ncbi:hypothetical protein B0H16DRAFT_1741599 [Mycena metata]|uniref:Uncharacterized protein n=1 Tax=Mycena metata TaxID=1033252 RepID=A0AAD7H9X8_9AGAR|nr:hypothetical protein B0H16DRAFT_1741599 [Mycena metata]